MCAPCCHFCLLFCWIEDPSRRIFGQKLFLNQSKNSDEISANSIFLCLCKVGNGGERAGLEFVPSGVGVSVAAGSGVCARLHLGRFVGWVWNVLGLGGGFAGVFFFSSGAGGVLEFGTGTAFLDAAGRVGGWVVHGTFLMNVYLVPQMKEGLHARLAEGVLGRELDLGGE